MKKIKAENGGITVFVIIAFLFCMTIVINLYWTNSNYGITALQAQERIKEIYEKDVNNINEIYENIKAENDINIVI